MTRDITNGGDPAMRAVAPLSDERDHEVEFAREAVAYLRASGLAPDEIERALCDEIGLHADEAHVLALAS